MKKIILLLLLLIPTAFIFADSWSTNVIAHYSLHSNANDDVGTYNGTLGASTYFGTDGIYYFARGTEGGNAGAITLPGTLWTTLGTCSNFSIQARIKSLNNTDIQGFINACPPLSDTGFGWRNQPASSLSVIDTTSGYAILAQFYNTTGWDLISVEYDGTNHKINVWGNGALICAASSNNHFASAQGTSLFMVLGETYNVYGGYFDMRNLIFANTLQAGVEIVPISPTPTYTWTLTPTFTATITPTYTITPTPIVNFTQTPPVIGNRIVGYRITFTNGLHIVSMIGDQNFQESEFDYQLYLVAKPAGITITPINQ